MICQRFSDILHKPFQTAVYGCAVGLTKCYDDYPGMGGVKERYRMIEIAI